MKKVKNGKLYDTDTAKAVGSYEPSPYKSDFNWFCETLYQKRSGEFFIHGEGNANSRYSRSCGQNEWCGGEKIIPLSYEKAKSWAEEHLDGDEYIKVFGEPEEDDTKQVISCSLTKTAIAKLKQGAAEKGISMSEYIESLIR